MKRVLVVGRWCKITKRWIVTAKGDSNGQIHSVPQR